MQQQVEHEAVANACQQQLPLWRQQQLAGGVGAPALGIVEHVVEAASSAWALLHSAWLEGIRAGTYSIIYLITGLPCRVDAARRDAGQ